MSEEEWGSVREVDKTEVQKKCTRTPVLEIVGTRHEKQAEMTRIEGYSRAK